MAPIERALLDYCSDKFNLQALLEGGADPSAAAQTALTRARKEVLELEKKLERLNAALLVDDGATPLSIIRMTREIEEKLDTARQQQQQAEGDVARATRKQTPQLASAWKALVRGTLALDYETRMKARQLVADTFERIVVYHQGVDPEGENRAPIDIVLIAKGGAPRMIRINRRTGELIEQEDVS